MIKRKITRRLEQIDKDGGTIGCLLAAALMALGVSAQRVDTVLADGWRADGVAATLPVKGVKGCMGKVVFKGRTYVVQGEELLNAKGESERE